MSDIQFARKALPPIYRGKYSVFSDAFRVLEVGECFSVLIDRQSPAQKGMRCTQQRVSLKNRAQYFGHALDRQFAIRTIAGRFEIHRTR